ncbi:MAG TPA: hypothetical protein VH637_15845 [Streptosporangiaceae bacterium]|jgi:hypothetical protein
MEPLAPEQWAELLGSCQRSAFHLEMRDWYSAADEKGRFERFLATGRRDHAAEAPERRAWLDLIHRITSAGVRVRRARIVSEPVTDYIRFEWHGAGPSIEAGEEVRWLPRRLASALALPGNDFWLLDERTAMFNHFSGDGVPLGQEITNDPAAVELCRTAFESVWARAESHEQYTIRR